MHLQQLHEQQEQQHPLTVDTNDDSLMIIGARAECWVWLGPWCPYKRHPKKIIVRKASDEVKWEWDLDNIKQQDIPPKVKACIEDSYSITEVKRVANGSMVVAIVGNAAMIFDVPSASNHNTHTIRFAICVENTHTLELLPNDFLAVATTGQTQSDGIEIYDLRTSTPLAGGPDPNPVQTIQGFPAVHGLLWDETDQKLWAVGNDKAPKGDERSQGILRGFSFAPNSDRSTVLQVSEEDEFIIRPTDRLTAEWGSRTEWRNGPHDLVGIPNTRKVLVTSDLSVVGVDIESRVFLDEPEVDKILEGFTPIGGNRHGLPRSDIKSMSINGEGRVMYVQATWRKYYSDVVNVIEGKRVTEVRVWQDVYKARWFADIPGWPAA
ncbi:hypothetical protein CKAH01_18735 [Colletotrichum kahawae]|uniref:Uncharacterized protein n=1 Tax=Colletotrichum kahawae TaxID=34407 RepID=A0AAD9Y6Q1_COLKA|nr:hypothetical protein CKAH01_18735 [Colletotrichum kahawae]